MAPGKIALPTTPKLESQAILNEPECARRCATKRLLKGAALGTAAWLVVTTVLKGGPAWDHERFAPWGWKGHGRGSREPVGCGVWDDFDFDAPMQFGHGRNPHPHPHGQMHPHPGPSSEHAGSHMHPPPPPPPGAPRPHPGEHYPHHKPHHPDPHAQVYQISTAASEVRLASLGFLGHGILRVEPAPEDQDSDVIQVEVHGAHGRVCVLKGQNGEDVGLGLVGHMRGRGRGREGRGRGWWWQKSNKRDHRHSHERRPSNDTQEEEGEEEFEMVDQLADHPHPPHPPHGGHMPPPPPGDDLPPPPPGGQPHPHPPPPGPHPPSPGPHPPHPHFQAPIFIKLRVPAGQLPALKTRLPFFKHDLALESESADKVVIPTFSGLDLSTRHASISLGSVFVHKGYNATLRSRNAPIHGSITILDGWAELETKNAPVEIEAVIRGGGIDVKSSNAPITASLDLQRAKVFNVSLVTSNAHLAVNVTSQPAGSELFFEGQTSKAPASVQLHPAFEGTFELQGSVVAPAVVVGEEQEGRKVEYEREGGDVTGSVWWETSQLREGGKVIVITSDAPNTLLL